MVLCKTTFSPVFAYILPAAASVAVIVMLLAVRRIRLMLFRLFPSFTSRDVRWGLYQTLLACTICVYGTALVVLTLALSDIGGTVTMGIAIALFVFAIAMVAYVFWLGVHYYARADGRQDIGLINKRIKETLEKAKKKKDGRHDRPRQ